MDSDTTGQRSKDFRNGGCPDALYDTIPCQQALPNHHAPNTFPRPRPQVPSKPVRRGSQTALPPIPSDSSPLPAPSRQLRTRCSNSEGDLLQPRGGVDLPATKARSATCAEALDSAPLAQSDQKFSRSLSLSHHSSDSLLEERPGEEEGEEQKCVLPPPPTDVTLRQFVNQQGRYLPKKGRVCKGYHSMCDQATITTGDVFTFHFIRCRSVVRAQDQNGTGYTIPLNSTALFGVVFDPHDNLQQACKGYHFGSVADMLALCRLPPLVRAKFSYNTTDGPEYCVFQGELFHPIGPIRIRNRLFLQAHSMSRNCRKLLAEDCASSFSTAPSDVQLHLYELSTNCKLDTLLPIHTVVYVSERSPAPLGDLAGELLHLKECATEVSVVATGDEEGVIGGDGQVIEMLDSLDIELQAMEVSREEEERLVRHSRQLYEDFNPQVVKYYMNKPPSSRVFETQTTLYQCVTLETHFKGLELVRSPKLSEVHSSSPQLSRANELELQLSKDGCFKVESRNVPVYYDPDPSSQAMFTYAVPNPSVYAVPTCNKTPLEVIRDMDQRLESLEEDHKRYANQVMQDLTRISSELGRINDRIRQIDEANAGTKALCGRLKEEVAKSLTSSEGPSYTRPDAKWRSLSPDGTKLDRVSPEDCYDVIHKMDNGSLCLRGYQDHQGAHENGYELMVPKSAVMAQQTKVSKTTPTSSQEAKENRDALARLDPNEVIKLLNQMGLNQYTGTFSTEQISGDILSECSEQMLQEELKINSKLHRMRLLKVISGSQNIRALLGTGAYS